MKTENQTSTTTHTDPAWLSELSKPRPSIFVVLLINDWMAIFSGIYLFHHFHNLISFLAGSILVGYGQHGLLILGHEAVHKRICKNQWLNEFTGNLFCYFPITLTVSAYRGFHLPHHRDPLGKEDPEVPLRKAIGKSFEPPFSMGRGMKLWALSYLGFSLREMYHLATNLPKPDNKEGISLLAFWAAVVATMYFTSTPFAYLGLYFHALATTYISKLRIQAWFEHGQDHIHTSRYALPNHFYRFIAPHNIWVHWEHHQYPSIPFYNLEKARSLISGPKINSVAELCEDLNRKSTYYGKKAA